MEIEMTIINVKFKSLNSKKKITPYYFKDKLCEVKWTDITAIRDEKLRDIKEYDVKKGQALSHVTDYGKIVFVDDYFLSIASSIGEGLADVTNIPISNIHSIRELK